MRLREQLNKLHRMLAGIAGSPLAVVVVPVATSGPCGAACHTFDAFMCVLFLMCASVATSQMPLLMVVLRSAQGAWPLSSLGILLVLRNGRDFLFESFPYWST